MEKTISMKTMNEIVRRPNPITKFLAEAIVEQILFEAQAAGYGVKNNKGGRLIKK